MQRLLDDGFHICKLIKSKGFEIFFKTKHVMLFVFRMSSIRSSLNHIHFLLKLVQTKAPTFQKNVAKIITEPGCKNTFHY